MRQRSTQLFLFIALLLVGLSVSAQRQPKLPAQPPAAAQGIAPAMLQALQWRNVGPARGGRSIACTGVVGDPHTYYFGATGGGLWKTTDGGMNWAAVTDSFLTSSSVGAVAVAPSDPNVLYIGTGERDIRGNISPGDGLYKSLDAGKTWHHTGLREATFIGRIVVHPTNPDVVYVAALGRVFGESKERGVYRSTDGGKTWQNLLFVDTKTGAVHIAMDPANPRVLYASMWECYRKPWQMSSGGPGSGLYKSTDGGDTWQNISQNPGLPKGILGKIGVTVSPLNSNRVWAVVENEKGGGLFLSDDAGATWRRTSEDRNIRQRAWYYSHVIADPASLEGVYVLNVNFHKSVDGGQSFSTIESMHGDHHDLWIDPTNPSRMILADDGGATVTQNGGQSWTDLEIPTAQLYHVHLDNAFPYNIYGAQQDNSTIAGPSRTTDYNISTGAWYPVAGGESGYIAIDPKNSNITYGGSYDGYLTRMDRTTGQERDISPYPDNPMGAGAGKLKYRFQWTYPIIFSPHDATTLYATANVVFRSRSEGADWEVISPDLTRNDTTKMGPSGGPITGDNTSVEYYGTIFAFAESPLQKDLLWAGSDDGRIHISTNGGTSWQDVTPAGLPEFSLISILEPGSFQAGTCYLAATRYKLDDFTPLLYRTTDFGKTWQRITTGIPAGHFTHVVREDPNSQGLLYAGTEFGIYVSFDAGANWQPLQLNLPVTPIRDLQVHKREKDLVVAAHGRSFWVLDDLTPLHQLKAEMAQNLGAKAFHLFQPRHAYRMPGGSYGYPNMLGANPPAGAMIHFYLKAAPAETDTVTLRIYAPGGKLVRKFSSREDLRGKAVEADAVFYEPKDNTPYGVVPTKPGLNRLLWDLRTEGFFQLPGAILWAAGSSGPKVPPGSYRVVLQVGKDSTETTLEVRLDPRLSVPQADLDAQFAFAKEVAEQVTRVHKSIDKLRKVRTLLNDQLARFKGHAMQDSLKSAAKPLLDGFTEVEETLIQTRIKAGQDALNYPIKLNNKLAGLLGGINSAEAAPTAQSRRVYAELMALIEPQLAKLDTLLTQQLPALNALIAAQQLPALVVPEDKK